MCKLYTLREGLVTLAAELKQRLMVHGLPWPCWLFAEERWVEEKAFQLTLKARVVAASAQWFS